MLEERPEIAQYRGPPPWRSVRKTGKNCLAEHFLLPQLSPLCHGSLRMTSYNYPIPTAPHPGCLSKKRYANIKRSGKKTGHLIIPLTFLPWVWRFEFYEQGYCDELPSCEVGNCWQWKSSSICNNRSQVHLWYGLEDTRYVSCETSFRRNANLQWYHQYLKFENRENLENPF